MSSTAALQDTTKATSVDLERLRKKRFIDADTAAQMISIGWRQGESLEGLLYCAACQQPTVWKDATGVPSHLWCSDFAGGVK